MLKSLNIRGFRNHASTEIQFSPKLTVLLGHTGAGKTSVLDALSYLFLGANHLTNTRGRGASKLIRQGAKTATLTCDVNEIGAIKRTIYSTKQTLTVPGCNETGTRNHQEFLLDALGTNAETLSSLLDVTPILSRKPEDQFTFLLKALRPPVIEPSDFLQENGIKQIASVTDLLELIKYRKEEVLRGLNRELSTVEKLSSEASVVKKPPNWPVSGNITEENLNERLKTRRKELAEATTERDRLQGRIDGDEAAKKRLENVLAADIKDDDGQEHRQRMIKAYKEQIESADVHIAEFETQLATLQHERSNLMEVRSKHEADSAVWANVDKGCPTCKRPWPANTIADAHGKLSALKTALDKINVAIKEKDTSIGAYQTNLDEARTSRKQLNSLLQEAETKIIKFEAAAKAGEPIEVVLTRLKTRKTNMISQQKEIVKLTERVEAGEECTRMIEAYHLEKQALEANSLSHASRMQELAQNQIPYEQRVISDLEGIKKLILDARVSEFEAHVNDAMKEMGQPEVSFDLESGWMSDGRSAVLLSGGQTQVCFETAYRYGLAKTSGVPLLVIDHLAPIDESIKQRLMKFLYLSGLQVVMAWTAEKMPTKARPPGLDIYWVSAEKGTAVVSQLPVPGGKAA